MDMHRKFSIALGKSVKRHTRIATAFVWIDAEGNNGGIPSGRDMAGLHRVSQAVERHAAQVRAGMKDWNQKDGFAAAKFCQRHLAPLLVSERAGEGNLRARLLIDPSLGEEIERRGCNRQQPKGEEERTEGR